MLLYTKRVRLISSSRHSSSILNYDSVITLNTIKVVHPSLYINMIYR